jgi:hypothetical protein
MGDVSSPDLGLCSFGYDWLGRSVSSPSSLKMDFRFLVILLAMENEDGPREPSRIRSFVCRWWNLGLTRPEERISGSEDDSDWTKDMMAIAGGTVPLKLYMKPPTTIRHKQW